MIPVGHNLKSLVLRPAMALAAIGTLAVAVFVYACSHMLILAVRAPEGRTGDERLVIFMSQGASGETTSRLREREVRTLDTYEELAPLDTIARGAPELVTSIRVGLTGTLRLRGVTTRSFALRPNARLVSGRGLAMGRDEVLLGRAARRLLEEHGVLVGNELKLLPTKSFPVVGEMRADNAAFDTEVWMDLQTLRAFFADAGATSVYTAALASRASLDELRERVEKDARLDLSVATEAEIYGARVQGLSRLLQGITVLVAAVLMLGAFFGAMTSLFAIVRVRSREIGTMKALGFERSDILLAYLIESLVVSLIAGTIGLGGAHFMRFVRFEAFAAGGEGVIGVSFQPTPVVIAASFGVAAALGILGGYLPAVMASRVSPMEAIRGG